MELAEKADSRGSQKSSEPPIIKAIRLEPDWHEGTLMKPPQTMKTSITAGMSDSAENSSADSLHWGSDLPSSYEILRREGEIHEGRATVLDELQRNFARLEDLHGQLHFVMREVESVLRIRS